MKKSAAEIMNSPKQQIRWWVHFLKAKTKHIKRDQVESLSKYIPSGAIVLDIGANFGYVAKELCSLHNGGCTVYCFEPVSYTHSILKKIMQPFKNAHLIQMGLSDAVGTTNINIPLKPSGALGFGISHMGEETSRDYVSEQISLTTLDTFASENNLPRLDFIKCDVEGAEILVFKGGIEALKKFMPTIFTEVDDAYLKRLGYTAQDLFNLLCGIGYKSYLSNDLGQIVKATDGQYLQSADYIFKAE